MKKRREEMLKKEKPQPGDAGLNLRPAGAGDGLPAGAGPNPRREESVHSSNIEPLFEVVNLYFEDEVMPSDNLTFDAKSVRTVDENGFLHVAVSHISKETVNPYRGNEIPGWQERGLDPQRIYFGYRKGEELEKAAPTFNGLPLLRDHHHESAERPQKEFRIGTLGTEAAYRAPYLDNALVVTDASAIAEIENGDRVELSCSYRYVPVFEPGTFEGKPYDFVMTDIRGNHCALVVEGRAGPDVAVADSAENIKPRKCLMAKSKDFFRKLANLVLAKDAAPDAKVEEEEVERAAEIIEKAQGILDLHENTPEGVIDKPEGGDEEPDKKQEAPAVSDEVKKALDACGLDAENPDFQKAFAEGVKYGERKEKQEPKKLDSEHESEGMKKAMDEEEIVKSASDAAMNRFQSILDAQREVRPVVGEVAVNLASDSAETVYGAALDAMGVDKKAHPRSAWRSVFQVLARNRAEAAPHTASDAALAESPLKNIKVL